MLKPELIWPGYFPNEASVKELFSLLVEGLEPEDDVWYPQFGDQANPNAYRSVVGFVPDVLIEFSGETSLTVESLPEQVEEQGAGSTDDHEDAAPTDESPAAQKYEKHGDESHMPHVTASTRESSRFTKYLIDE
ncbi:MAG: hypothetical protein ABSF76_03555 [Opitutaceae bacterium]